MAKTLMLMSGKSTIVRDVLEHFGTVWESLYKRTVFFKGKIMR